jgi:hypothetical protein
MRDTADVTDGKPIAVLLQSISGVSAINPLVAFYDIHGGKGEVLFFYFVPNNTRDLIYYHYTINIPFYCLLYIIIVLDTVSSLDYNVKRNKELRIV